MTGMRISSSVPTAAALVPRPLSTPALPLAIEVSGNSLNNLRALNNVLNNNDVDVTVQDISVLSPTQLALLNCGACDDVVGVAVLSGGDIIVFTR